MTHSGGPHATPRIEDISDAKRMDNDLWLRQMDLYRIAFDLPSTRPSRRDATAFGRQYTMTIHDERTTDMAPTRIVMHSSTRHLREIEDYVTRLEDSLTVFINAAAELLHSNTQSAEDDGAVECSHCEDVLRSDDPVEVGNCAWLKLDRAMTEAIDAVVGRKRR